MKERLRSVKVTVKNYKYNLIKVPGKKNAENGKGNFFFLKKMAEKFPKLVKDMQP